MISRFKKLLNNAAELRSGPAGMRLMPVLVYITALVFISADSVHAQQMKNAAVIYGYSTPVISGGSVYKLTPTVGQFIAVDSIKNSSYSISGGIWGFFQLPPNQLILTASQGDYPDKIKLEWYQDKLSPPANLPSYKIYRDNILLALLSPDQSYYEDYNVVPGIYYNYTITGANRFGTSVRDTAVGFVNPNGTITGRVTTNNGTPVNDVEILITPNLGKALRFNGIDNYVDAGSNLKLGDTSFTIEFWMKTPNASNSGVIFAKNLIGNSSGDSLLAIGYNSSSLYVTMNTGTTSVIVARDTNWHHYAWTFDKTTKVSCLYIDSQKAGTITLLSALKGKTGKVTFGKGSSGYMSMLLDEFRVWMVARDSAGIVRNMLRTVNTQQSGLAAYWKMDEGKGSRVFDYATKNNTGDVIGAVNFSDDHASLRNTAFTGLNGYYIAEGINYGTSTNFTVTPDRPGRSFSPSDRMVTLSTSNTAVNSVDFTDMSQIPVTGYITHSGTSCLNDTTVEILVDDSSWTPQVFTNSQGKYLVEFSPGESHKLTPKRYGYAFAPAFYQVDSIRYPLSNKNFTQTMKYNLKVLAAGGECEMDLGGKSIVKINSMPSGCVSRTDTITSPAIFKYFDTLPPLKYMIEVKRADGIVFEADSVSLQDSSMIQDLNRTKKFIYHSPLTVSIDTSYLPKRGTCQKIVLQQLYRYKVRYRVGEYYNNRSNFCPVDSAMVSVNNEIGDVSPPYIVGPTDAYGYVTDTISTSYPNILNGGAHPYQKMLSVTATAPDGSTAQSEFWALVTGVKFRGGQTYISRSPEIPSLILRHPPGDLSQAYWAQGTTISTQLDLVAGAAWGLRSDYLISLAPKFTATAGTPFFSIGTEVKPVAQIIRYYDYENANSTIRTLRQQWTATEMISTAQNAAIPSGQGDVFVGAAYNFVFGKTNIVNFNDTTCSVVTDTGIIAAPDSILTKFVYTEYFLRNTMIPGIYSHMANYRQADSVIVRRKDSVAVLNWERILAYNDSLKSAALDSAENISFSAGASFSRTKSYTHDTSASVISETYEEDGPGIVLGLFGNEAGAQAGIVFRYRTTWGNNTINDTAVTTETGFTLGDDDVGDYFSVKVGQDKCYNTPVFKTIAGASSCPWETGTITRDSAVFNPTLMEKWDVHPDSEAVFALLLGNAGTTGESRNYLLSVVQQTNPDGLVVSVNGVIIENSINLTLPPGGGVQVMVTAKRGPLAYDYEGVQLFMQPECEPDPLHNGNFQMAAIANINVHFRRPCSPVNITMPEPGWLINSGNRDTMEVSIAGYYATLDALQNIKLQYRPSLKSNLRLMNPEFFSNAKVDAAGKVRSINFSGLPVVPTVRLKKMFPSNKLIYGDNNSSEGYEILYNYAKSTPKKYHLLDRYFADTRTDVKKISANTSASAKSTAMDSDGPETNRAGMKANLKSVKVDDCDTPTGSEKSSWMTFKTLSKANLTGTSYYTVPWVVTGIDDGQYDLRAVSTCSGNTIEGSSALITGTIDKTCPMVQGLPQPVSGILTGNDQIAISFTKQIQCYGLAQGTNIQLFYSSGPQSGQQIDFNFTCDGRTIIITPNVGDRYIENQVLRAVVKRVTDLSGNTMRVPVGTAYTDSISWEFVVNKSPVRWSGGDIYVSKYIDETLTVSRSLINSGGFSNPFYIKQVPIWMTASPLTGTVQNHGNIPISFTFGTNLGFGTYDTTVIDSTVYGDQPMRIHLQVLCHTPEWKVTAANYQYSMNIIGQLYIDTAMSRDINDRVGVFAGNECRGSGQVQQLSDGKYRVFLTVYSNTESGEQFRMRVWDSSGCSQYGFVMEEPFTFSANSVLGSYNNPQKITATLQTIQQYILPAGWSWLSFNTRSVNMSLNSALANLHPSDGDVIKEQTGFSQYVADSAKWFGAVDSLRNTKAYLMKLQRQDSLSRIGYPVAASSTPISVKAGWNWIGFTPQNNLAIGTALASLPAKNGDLVKSQFAFAVYDSVVGWVGNMFYMQPKYGYFLKFNSASTLTYPTSGKSSAPEIPEEQYFRLLAGHPGWVVKVNNYQFTMNIIAKLGAGLIDTVRENTVLGLFSGNECRGFVTPVCIGGRDELIFFITAYSNSPFGDSLLFRVYNPKHNRVLAFSSGIRFNADAVAGSLADPVIVSGSPLEVRDGRLIPERYDMSQNYPNPFNPTTSIDYALPMDGEISIDIYSIMGEKIVSLANGYKRAGFYTVIWDGRNNHNNFVTSGVYLCSMKAGKFSSVKKLTLIK